MKNTLSLNLDWFVGQAGLGFNPEDKIPSGGDGIWFKADMPEQLYNVLRKNDVLPDLEQTGDMQPYLDLCGKDWIYRKEFSLSPEDLSRPAELCIAGIDTFADVYLNGTLLAEHRDMYLPLRKDTGNRLQRENTLLLYFHSPITWIGQMDIPEQYRLLPPRHLVRIDSSGFSPYYGAKPYNRPLGIYDDVSLIFYDEAWLSMPDIRTCVAPDLGSAVISIAADALGSSAGCELSCSLFSRDGEEVYHGREPFASGKMLKEFTVDKPKLWWPAGYGEPYLYTLKLELIRNGRILDSWEKKLGLRRVSMESALLFKINGAEVRLWGANFAPLHAHSYVYDHAKASRMLEYARHANMNSLRIWGGGVPYRDELYDEADRLGLLLWQDFFHNWGMYPEDGNFRSLCRGEAEYMVKRLKHHPSILLWCGGNESYQGAEAEGYDHFFGWQIFEIDYREIVSRLDPQRYYHPNSPYGGNYAEDPSTGDSHVYSHIWFNRGWDYPLFQTENTRVFSPVFRSLKRMLGEENLWTKGYTGQVTKPGDTAFPPSWHARALLPDYLSRLAPIERFYEAGEPESLVYRFGAAHACHMKETIERQRRGRPADGGRFNHRRTAGHFVWRLFDTWPEIFCSIIDYYNEPYISFYEIRHAYSPLLISFEKTDRIFVWVVNDTPHEADGVLEVLLHNPMSGENIRQSSWPVKIGAGQAIPITDLDSWNEFKRENFLYASLKDKTGNCIARTNDYLDMERNLRFPEARLRFTREGDKLYLSTDKFARSVELSAISIEGDEFGWIFEDNYFDLFPWEKKEILLTGKQNPAKILAKARFGGPGAVIETPGHG
jgi:hypothetical protein